MTYTSGFSLIGLLVTLAIAGVLAGLAAPSMNGLLLESRMTAKVNELVHGMHLARARAVQGGREVVVCPGASAGGCRPGGAWEGGFVVFVNTDRDHPPQLDPGERVLQSGAAYAGTVRANRDAFIFRPFGARSVNGTLTVCDRRGADSARAIVVSYTGRPRTVPAASRSGVVNCVS